MSDLRLVTKPGVSTIALENGKLPPTTMPELVVVLHGILNGYQRIDEVVAAVKEHLPEAEVWVPKMPFQLPFLPADGKRVVEDLCHDLSAIWAAGRYRALRIVGHSMGGVYGRAMLLRGRREQAEWAAAGVCRRFVMLAAINGGVGINHHMKVLTVLKTVVALLLAGTLRLLGFEAIMYTVLRGSAFLTRMRLEWLEEQQKADRGEAARLPLVVQLLGSIDDIVGPEDSLDLVTGSRFRYLDVARTSHLEILFMERRGVGEGLSEEERAKAESDAEAREHRRGRFVLALLGSVEAIEEEEVRPWELEVPDADELARREAVEHVIFVVHGIRDDGHWTDKVARRIWERNKVRERPERIEKMVDSYGYFGMGPFLLPGARWKKVGWLMERYLKMRSLYPNARFSYIGHSHGTYVVAKALETYELCRFDNVVFAGSIVREEYDWAKLIGTKKDTGEPAVVGSANRGGEQGEPKRQVKKVLNMTATGDWVVASFPRFLGLYNLQDLGGAGHAGFTQVEHPDVHTVRYVKGGHGAGKEEPLWDGIADFVLDRIDGAPEVPKEQWKERHAGLAAFLGWGNVLLWVTIVLLLLVLAPAGILWVWPKAVRLGAAVVTNPWVLGGVGAVILAAYLVLAWRQRAYKRKLWQLRSFAAFPVALAIGSGAVVWVAGRLFPGVAAATIPPVEAWGPAVLVLWVFAVVWLLKRV